MGIVKHKAYRFIESLLCGSRYTTVCFFEFVSKHFCCERSAEGIATTKPIRLLAYTPTRVEHGVRQEFVKVSSFLF